MFSLNHYPYLAMTQNKVSQGSIHVNKSIIVLSRKRTVLN